MIIMTHEGPGQNWPDKGMKGPQCVCWGGSLFKIRCCVEHQILSVNRGEFFGDYNGLSGKEDNVTVGGKSVHRYHGSLPGLNSPLCHLQGTLQIMIP